MPSHCLQTVLACLATGNIEVSCYATVLVASYSLDDDNIESFARQKAVAYIISWMIMVFNAMYPFESIDVTAPLYFADAQSQITMNPNMRGHLFEYSLAALWSLLYDDDNAAQAIEIGALEILITILKVKEINQDAKYMAVNSLFMLCVMVKG